MKPSPTPAQLALFARPAATSTTSHQTQTYRRGDIWMVNEDPENPPVGTELWSNRPGIIVSNDVSNKRSGFVQIVYMSTSSKKRSGPVHIPVGSPLSDGREAMALCEQIHTVDVSRLRRKKGFLPRQIMNEIDSALMFSLSIGTETRTNTMFRKWESHIKEHGIDMAEEISAMSVRTTDQRVEALTRALQLIAAERDAYKTLYESAGTLPEVLDSAHALLESAENSLQSTRSHDERRTAG